MSKPRMIESVAPCRRRAFMRMAAAVLSAPLVPSAVRFAANEQLFGEAKAFALEDQLPTYFIEVNLRDQWDFGHVFVPPGIATNPNIVKGESGPAVSLFHDIASITSHGNGFYLTPDSQPLVPHLDNIAVVEQNELCIGAIHGHESVNAMRSPGRTKTQSGAKMPVWQNEPGFEEQGNDYFYSSTPTPACLHNYAQKQITPGLRNGVTLKYISRFHTVCHFGAGLADAELTRIQSVQQLFDTFPDTVEDLNVLATPAEAALFSEVMRRADAGFFARHGYTAAAGTKHATNLAEATGLLHTGEVKIISMPLVEEEIAYWQAGVPDQVGDNKKANIWEQAAWAFKLLSNDVTRSVSLEFDYLDVHDTRSQGVMQTMAAQTSIPLARLIDKFKEAGMWERTVIAMFSADGGRSPAAASYGNEGKSTLVLAGGKVKGGYFGDVMIAGDVAGGHAYGYRTPDDSGAPGPMWTDDGSATNNRLGGARAWRTVMKALEIPDELCDQYPDVAGVQPLGFMLNA